MRGRLFPPILALAVPAVLTLFACARLPEQTPTKPPSALPPGAVPPGAPGTPWARKTRPERMEFMGLVFFPKMKALFQSHDPRAYAQFRCQTCHGEDMEARHFQRPFGLGALPAGDSGAVALDVPARADVTRFMANEVVPATRELLGIDHPDGQSCELCHDRP